MEIPPDLPIPTCATCGTEWMDDDGSMLWRMTYHEQPSDDDISSAVSALESYIYLVESCTKEEAWRRIKLLRAARRRHQAEPMK